MKGWGDLGLEGKLGVVWALAGIAVCALAGYSVIRSIQMRQKIEKRMHLDGCDDE